MKISAKSWHFRLLRFYGWETPKNLCAYFWKVVLAIAMTPVFASGALLAATILLAPLWQFFVDDVPFNGIVAAGGIVDIAILSGLLASSIQDRRYQERRERRLRGEDPYTPAERKPSLLREWLRAKHEKVCPTLDFDWS